MYLSLKALKYTCNNFIFLFAAHDLAGSDQGGFNDPYMRLSLIPAVDNRRRQTTSCKNDHNLYIHAHFKFSVSHKDLQDKILVLQVISF
jgi:hypothetical protein